MDIDMIKAAAARAAGVVRKTPLLSSPFLDDIAGRRVWVKMETLQHTGSFKFRGAWSALSAMDGQGGVIAYSSGNHAQGIALAAQMQGREAVIVMPKDAPHMKIENTKAYGAEVVLYDRAGGEDREAIGSQIAHDRGLQLVAPFDNPYVIAGQGTCGLEIADQAAQHGIDRADVLVCCGGGGLTSGIALALEAAVGDFTVRPAEPEGFDDVARSLRTGAVQRNASVSGSICDAIITPAPGELTWPILQRLCGPGLVVSDEQCLKAMAHGFARLKAVIEPGGAAALAAALFAGQDMEAENVICVATGGNVDADMFAKALQSI